MPNLYPEGYESEVIRAEDLVTGSPVGYRSGVSFDYLAGDYAKDGRNRLLDCTGIESWKSWCINCIQTERYKHLAYSTDFGIELDKVFAAESRGKPKASSPGRSRRQSWPTPIAGRNMWTASNISGRPRTP